MMKVTHVLTGKPEKTLAKAGLTGHFKTPVEEANIGQLGLSGDHIMDLDNHGGVDQAVYVFGDIDRQWWAQTLKCDVPPGHFGENLLISDLETGPLAIGDILTIGEVVLQITSPRIPCATYAAHIGSGQAIKQFYSAGRPGAYGRVLQSGRVTPGANVTLTAYQGERISMVENMRACLDKFADDDFLSRALTVPAHYKLHDLARERLHKA